MKPEMCRVKDNPPQSYGDCVRACVASILEMSAETVPHFFENPEIGQMEMQEWLAIRGQIAATIALPGDWSFDEVGHHMTGYYPNVHYMLWCSSGGGDHAVIGCNDEIAHDPAWYRRAIDGPHSAGFWIVWIIAKL
ncbi:hypothetical protein [Rhizobium phage RHph_X2_24]|nr:hypothetical protein [Rhizobium phage RHph_X2_24]